MRRSGFKRPDLPPRTKSVPQRGTGRGAITAVDAEVRAAPKDAPVRSEPYRRLVASLPCDNCGTIGHSQAAHADQGKGMGVKTCDLTCYPACGPHTVFMHYSERQEQGCHSRIGSSGYLTREDRREYEAEAAARTRLALIVMAQDDAKVRKILQDVGLL